MAFTKTVEPYAAFLAWFQIALLLWIATGHVGASLSTQLGIGLAAVVVGLAHAVHYEKGGSETDLSENARKLEQLVLDIYTVLDREDICVVETALGPRVELTESGRQKLFEPPEDDGTPD